MNGQETYSLASEFTTYFTSGFYCMADKQEDTQQDLEKTHWHIFSLQKLSPGNFVKILGRVFKNELRLIK